MSRGFQNPEPSTPSLILGKLGIHTDKLSCLKSAPRPCPPSNSSISQRDNCSEGRMRKTALGRDYIFGIIVYFQWLRGRTTYNVASLFCWLVASPRNQKLGDPSSATFSCLTIYTASKMTRCKSLLSQLRYFPTICASCKKMDLLFPLRWATSRGHSTGSVNAIPIAVRENRFVPSRHSSDQMCWLMADWVIDLSNIPAYGLP